jgi:crotonobetainyl-CoA:carnitine CoA-transferase CaiB-like acyl-CoA transferase
MITAEKALGHLYREVTGELAGPAVARIVGDDPQLPGRFRVAAAAAASIGATTLAAGELLRARGGDPGPVSIDARHAAIAFRSERYLRVNGSSPGDIWAPLSGDYPAVDGWVKLHCNYPRHATAVTTALDVPADREAVADAVATRTAQQVEEAVLAAGGAAAAMRSPTDWHSHPAGRAARLIPLVDIERIGETDAPRTLPNADRPLAGVRVLDLTHVIAGPACGRVLAAHGADVLHVGAAHLPTVAPLVVDHGFGKRTCHLDLRTEDGQQTLRALIADADVLIQSYRPGTLAARGFGPADLAKLRPGIITLDLSAYGHSGPWRDRRGFDSLVQMACGIADDGARVLGVEEPRPLPAQALDHGTGWLGAFGIITALRRSLAEGGSWQLRVALARTAAWLDDLGRTLATRPEAPDPGPEEVADLLAETQSQIGLVRHVSVPGDLPGAPPRWSHGPHIAGSDPAVWW